MPKRIRPRPSSAPRSASRPLPEHRFAPLALAIATAFVFAGAIGNGWLNFDDNRYVTANPHVNGGFGLGAALWFLGHAHGENWHPVASWSHLVDWSLFGPAAAGPHAVNVLLHALNAGLLAWVLARLTGARGRSLAVAALFALHPLRVESVAWISERKDVLSGTFFLLAIEAWRRWTARPGRGRYAVVAALTALGLMAKPMLVTLPFVLVLLDAWPLGRLRGGPAPADPRARPRARARSLGGLVAEKAPLIALAAASAVATFLVQRGAGAMVAVETFRPGEKAANALVSVWRYLGRTAWPSGLAVLYPFHRVPPWSVALAALGLVAVIALALVSWRRRPWIAVGAAWFLGMLVPVIGLVQVGSQAWADRYTYLPGIGVALALVWSVADWAAGVRGRRLATQAALAAALVALSVSTVRQVGYWKDTATLFGRALEVTRDNPVAHEVLAEELIRQGRFEPAIGHLERALALVPGYADAHANLGLALGSTGRLEAAADQFRASLAERDRLETRHNLAFTLARLGRREEALAVAPPAERAALDTLARRAAGAHAPVAAPSR